MTFRFGRRRTDLPAQSALPRFQVLLFETSDEILRVGVQLSSERIANHRLMEVTVEHCTIKGFLKPVHSDRLCVLELQRYTDLVRYQDPSHVLPFQHEVAEVSHFAS
jgi:hypothetical protein